MTYEEHTEVRVVSGIHLGKQGILLRENGEDLHEDQVEVLLGTSKYKFEKSRLELYDTEKGSWEPIKC